MIALSLDLLGPFRASIGGQPVTHFRTKSVQALLIYLAEETQPQPREFLAELLYPGLPTVSSLKDLRQTLYELRKLIPDLDGANRNSPIPFLQADRQFIQINPEGTYEIDTARFGELVSGSVPERLEAAMRLYRGDFLADFYLPNSSGYDSWMESKRTLFRIQALEALDQLANHFIEQKNYSKAKKYAIQQLELDDLRESSLRHLMTVMALSGERSAALLAYQEFRKRLQVDLNVHPTEETTALFERIRTGRIDFDKWERDREHEPERVDVSTASQKTRHNLPVHLTPFIGRHRELADLKNLIKNPGVRLITIVGQGGIGKTRLGLAAAEEQLRNQIFSNGVFFVPLVGLGESERIVNAIAEALQIRLQEGEDQLHAYLRNKHLLLILDNFEHLLDGSHVVLNILQAARQVKVVVTSRERLHLHGEQVYPIYGFGVEDETALDDARQLFLQSAQRIRPDFQQNAENQLALTRLCRLVDGMPLALELASGWIDMLSPEDIVKEIQRSLDFLESDLRDQPDRHRSMRAVFDTSWNNLSSKSQQVLAQVSVFRGGFSREAARVVTGATLRDLMTLVDKSLISFDPQKERYVIHELLRQYCLTKIDHTEVSDRHQSFFFDFLIEQAKRLTGGEMETAVSRIEVEMDNIRAAINHSLDSKRLERLDKVIRRLSLFYMMQSHLQEGVFLINHILTQLSTERDVPAGILFWLIAIKLDFLESLGRGDESSKLRSQCQELLEKLSFNTVDIRAEEAFLDYIEGFYLYNKQPEKSQQLFQKSYELNITIGDRWFAAYSIMGKGRAARNQGDLTEAEEAIRTSLTIFQDLNYTPGIAQARRMLGVLAGIAGRYIEAEQVIKEGLVLARKMNLIWEVANGGLDKLRMVYFYSGRFEDGLVPNAEYLSISDEYGFTLGVIKYHIAQGLLYLHLGRYMDAQKLGTTAVQLAQEYNQVPFLCEALVMLAQATLVKEQFDTAQKQLETADTLFPSRPVGMSLYVGSNHLYWGILAGVTERQSACLVQLRIVLEDAIKRKGELNLANAIALGALLKAIEGNGLIAVELYALACQHPFISNSRWFEDVIGSRIKIAVQDHSAEAIQSARARGQTLDLWEKANELLLEMSKE